MNNFKRPTQIDHEIVKTVECAISMKIPYKLEIIGYVDNHASNNNGQLEIRQLIYRGASNRDLCFREQMIRVSGGMADRIVCHAFMTEEECKNLPLEK